MFWKDIILKDKSNKAKLTDSVAKVFSVSKEEVKVVDDVEDFLEIDTDRYQIIIHHIPKKGDFQLMLSIYVMDRHLVDKVNNLHINQLAQLLNMECLIANDDSINPYSMILIHPDGVEKAVFLKDSEDDDMIVVQQ